MALSNSAITNTSIISSSHIVTTKLASENYHLWKVNISTYLRGEDLFHFIDGSVSPPSEFLPNQTTIVNLAYTSWRRTDQLMLSVLFSSLSNFVIGHVLLSNTSKELWNSLAVMFASQSQAKEFNIYFQLTHLSQGSQNITEYFGKVLSLTDTLAATSNPLPDKEFVTYLLIGFGASYE